MAREPGEKTGDADAASDQEDAVAFDEVGALTRIAEKQLLVGQRLDLEALMRHEASVGYKRVGVVVCGPPGMCDDVRFHVAGVGRSAKTGFELDVDAFSWCLVVLSFGLTVCTCHLASIFGLGCLG